jgi:hypothetical protein
VARIRTIKPDFFRNEEVAALTYRARLTWVGLWTYADDEGRGKDNARIIKGDLWPLEDDVTHLEVEADLCELEQHGRITRYEANGERYLFVNKWLDHQRISKPTASKLPPPPAPEDSRTTPVALPEGSRSTTGGLPIGKEKEREVEEEVERDSPTASDEAKRSIHEDFMDFYLAYPRKEARGTAERAYAKALKKTDAATILAGAERYAVDPNRDPQYTKLPATWLNAESWEDEPLPVRGGPQPARMDRSAMLRAKEADMLARFNAANEQPLLQIED